jgi:two-component system sensor histidine kinase EvgS
MQKEEFDLHKLVSSVFRALQFPAKQKKLELINEVPVHFLVFQYMEPLRVLIYNLVMNSVNFTKQGTITVQSSMDRDSVIITVSDTGIGMNDQQIANLQSDERIIASANVDNRKGTGLGYLIIKDLLKAAEGKLKIKSKKNTGTQISITLPSVKSDNTAIT